MSKRIIQSQTGKIIHLPTIMETHRKSLYWDVKCAACGCTIPAGQPLIYTPATRMQREMGNFKPVTTHCPEDTCGTSYTVHVIYHATRKHIKVTAYHASVALETAKRRVPKNWGTPREYHVYQGNVCIKREAA